MTGIDNNDNTMHHISGKLSEHFAYLNDDGTMQDGTTINWLHCKKQFMYHGSHTSLTYHLQH